MPKCKYETHVKPYLDKIKHWRSTGADEKQIIETLGVGKSAFYEYKKKYPELAESLKKGTADFVIELRSRLALLTEKHTLQTKKQYIKKDQETGNRTEYTEITTKEVDGDVAAINLLLKNLDRDNWANDPQSLELKKQELELKRKMAEANSFDLDLSDD